VLLSSIANVHAVNVTFFKIDSAYSTFMDPTQTYNGYTPGTNIRYLIFLNVTTKPGGPVVKITNLTITDTLPVGLTYVSGSQLSDPSAASFSVVGQELIWNWSTTQLSTVVNPPNVPANTRYEATAEINATVGSTVADNTLLTNNAATAYNVFTTKTIQSDTTYDTIWIARPILDIIKQSPTIVENGSSFNYVLTLNNTGHLDATGVSVTDLLPSGIMHTPGTSTATSGSFAVDSGTQVVWTGTIGNITGTHVVIVTIPVTANTPAHSVLNSANYTAYPCTAEFTHSSASCTTTVLHPKIKLTKVPSAPVIENDTSVTYTYNVTNIGDTPLSSVSITDNTFGVITSGQSLAVGQSLQFTKMVTLTLTTTNTATASGADELNTVVTAQASATVTVLHPKIKLTKVPSAPVIENDTSVTYTYNVTNIGDTPLSSVSITDNTFGVITSGQSLAVGQSLQFTKMVTLTLTTTNTATASGADELNTVVTAQASATVTVLHPKIKLTKVPSATMVSSGSSVTYTFDVTNTGDTALSNVNITDSAYGVIASNQSLAVGQSKVFTRMVVMTSTTTDTATAVGVDTLGAKVSASASATVTVKVSPPPAVGGVSASVNAFKFMATWSSLISLVAAALLLKGLIARKKREKKADARS
jgi:uncharacterized repeat protein (TIGR01451 family)